MFRSHRARLFVRGRLRLHDLFSTIDRLRVAANVNFPLILSRVHWVRPELVAEVKYLTWTEDNLLRQVVYEGLREDKPAVDVRRAVPYPKPAEPVRLASRPQRPRSS